MRKSTTLTALIAAGALAVGGAALAPAALAATADDDATSTTENGERRGPGAGHRPGSGHDGDRGDRSEHRGAAIAIILETLGITVDELRDAREEGLTLAELAEAQGVDVDTLVDALVAAAEEHIAEHVADGDLTQEEADERLAEFEERITDRVTGEAPERGDGDRGMHQHGEHRG
ncbi:hypothetical protein [Yonghaparkia sp. Root332]|uniref:hypothetical protein n=1 Tax=Yonghaparkia sp. Root332 TaxID=1736516 RepID=UPI0007022DAD|nr:hypothetical protein [Yonghaparkia sp. Root332]KQV26531.1 hypothetical protein ASC54_06600 [Yonghaparkia sp. Root332]